MSPQSIQYKKELCNIGVLSSTPHVTKLKLSEVKQFSQYNSLQIVNSRFKVIPHCKALLHVFSRKIETENRGYSSFFRDFFFRFYLFIFREEKGWRKRGRETSMHGCLSCTPHWGPGLKPRYVSSLGIEPVTFQFTGWWSVPGATPARAILPFKQ